MANKKQFPSDKQDQYMVRFPDGMRDRLKEEAAKNKRSLNAEIVARLAESLERGPMPGERVFTEAEIEAMVEKVVRKVRSEDDQRADGNRG